MSCASHRWAGYATIALLLGAPLTIHYAIGCSARLDPPEIELAPETVEQVRPNLSRIGASYLLRRNKLLQVGLVGRPEQVGYAHAQLLRQEMLQVERALQERFRQHVSWAVARMLLLDIAQYRYRNIDHGLSAARKLECASMAVALEPDPLRHFLPTYQRLVYLAALYDIGLSFEHSPLVGCSSFVISGTARSEGGALLARTFDFSVDEIFDERKAVFLVREEGMIPFASVAWPGLVGVVTGMNAAGVAVVVHGARAGEPQTTGEPVVHALRRVLSVARTTEEAVATLLQRDAMVSHIVIVADAQGRAVAVERLAGRNAHPRWLGPLAAVTNHFEGPAAADPRNQRVRHETSSLARRRRGDELLAALEPPISVSDALQILRDRRGPGGQSLPLGDRRAIDALIATHGVVMDTAARVLWVSEGPHLLGRFVAFDLHELLSRSYNPLSAPSRLPALAPDPLLSGGEYARWRAQSADGE
jgi:isopenicillin-N N-acyltransferase-like protein